MQKEKVMCKYLQVYFPLRSRPFPFIKATPEGEGGCPECSQMHSANADCDVQNMITPSMAHLFDSSTPVSVPIVTTSPSLRKDCSRSGTLIAVAPKICRHVNKVWRPEGM